MKNYKEVQQTRQSYHQDPHLNSVHRSSLQVPRMPGCETEISFLNHFLIKRSYKEVGCRITAIDDQGKRIEARLFNIDEPCVYRFCLEKEIHKDAHSYMVEFFTNKNLFIPFPAVMVNHVGNQSINTVHAFNRVLNDVFEDDAINSHRTAEAAIDVEVNDQTDTFALFMTGQAPVKDHLRFDLSLSDGSHLSKVVDVNLPRFHAKNFFLSEVFPELKSIKGGVLKILQPRQPLFYDRMLSGRIKRDGSFTGNHSYYDSSTTNEYWENDTISYRLYPYFADFSNILRFYPIISPSILRITLEFFDVSGNSLGEDIVGELDTSGNRGLEINVNQVALRAGIQAVDIGTYCVFTEGKNGENPTRVNHQIVHRVKNALDSSINVSLVSDHFFKPTGKPGLTWGQMPHGKAFQTHFGIVFNG